MRFILYTLVVFFICFCIYNASLILFPFLQNKKNYQSWWQENDAKVQQYAYNDHPYQIVITGTSMSASIPVELFSKNAYTLGFVGGASLTGLEIVKRCGNLPEILLIETNWIERQANKGTANAVFNPFIKMLKQNLPGLQEANQPVNILGNIILKNAPSVTEHIETPDSTFLKIRLAENIVSHNMEVDTMALKNSIKETNNYINFFYSKGVKVYLIEIPVHHAIASSKKYLCTRKFINKYIDRNIYDTIPEYPNLNELTTSDGYHLTKESMYKYTLFLNDLLK